MKNKLIPYIIIGILVIAGLVVAGFYFVKKQKIPVKPELVLEKILPKGAFIREKLNLDIDQDGQEEILVLYGLNTERIKGSRLSCIDMFDEAVKGDFYLALIDNSSLQSQVEIPLDLFVNKYNMTAPEQVKILQPKDINGDGKNLEFVLSQQAGCVAHDFVILGYSLRDRKIKKFSFYNYKEGKEKEEPKLASDIIGFEEGFLKLSFIGSAGGGYTIFEYYKWEGESEKFIFEKRTYLIEESFLKILLKEECLAKKFPERETGFYEIPEECLKKEKLSPEKAPADETANWKTYRNEKYGFEIKYPPGFFYSEENEGVRFIENEWENITGNFPYIGIDILQTTAPIEDFFKEEKKRLVNEGYRFFEDGCDMRCVSKQAKEIVIKEIKALKYRDWGVSGGNDNVIIRHSSRDLIIKIYKHNSGWGEKGTYSVNGVIPDEIFNKMLSTLRFY